MNRAIIAFALLVLFVSSMSLPASAAGKDEPRKVRICIVAGSSPDAVVKQWYPLISYLTDEVGVPFEIAIRESYEDMLEDYRKGELDVLISGPFNYVKTKDSAGARLLAEARRPEGSRLRGYIVTLGGSGIDGIADLAGRSFAFTEPYSTTGYLMPRMILAEEGIDQPADYFGEVVFSGHHSESLESVITGNNDAAAVVGYLADQAIRDRGADLKVIAKTPELPQEPIFARPGMDAGLVERIRNALLAMHERVPPDVMKSLDLESFSAGSDSNYDVVRQAQAKLANLPPIAYSVDYGIVPTALAEAVESATVEGGLMMFAIPACATVIFLILLVAMRGRIRSDIKVGYAFTILAAMILIAFAVSALSATNLKRRLDNISLAWQRNINTFVSQAAKFASEDEAGLIQPLAEGLAEQSGVLYVKAFRNGRFIADSRGEDAGHSIIPKIASGTFRNASEDAIDTTSYVMSGERRFANVLIGLDAGRLHKAVRTALIGNLLVILVLIGLGLWLAAALSRRVIRPITMLSDAVADVRSGKKPELDTARRADQIGSLMRSFREMEAEIRHSGELLGQKSAELEEIGSRLERMQEREAEIEEAMDEVAAEVPAGEVSALDDIREGMSADEHETEEQATRSKELAAHIENIQDEMPRLAELRRARIIGESPAFLRVIRDIIIRSRDSDPVLLYGESGSGKTGVAEAIHALSARGSREMVEYNCAELAAADPVIVLGKLFGYGRDSGLPGVPREGQRGLLEECAGSTLFLDEIALLPKQTQGALLLPLEGRPFNPAAGKGGPRSSDARIIFASNVSLEDEVAAGRFRHDLLRRIRSRGSIEIPPLRARMEDIERLAQHFLGLWCAEKQRPMSFDAETLSLLIKYDYHKFNVAELATAVKIAADNALFRESEIIKPEFLGEELGDMARRRAALADDSKTFDDEERRELEVLREHDFRIGPSEAQLGYSRDAKTLTNHLRGMAFKALALTGWDAEEAAGLLSGKAGPAARSRVRRKIELYLRNVSKLASSGDQKRLFNNLPQKYHANVEEAISRLHG